MNFYYGDKNLLRILDEAAFWKNQEAEHTVVIRQIIPNLDFKYVAELQRFQNAFTQTKNLIVRYSETVIRSEMVNEKIKNEIISLVEFCINQSKEFIRLLNNIEQSDAVVNNLVAQIVIDHIRRESEYFIGIAQSFLEII